MNSVEYIEVSQSTLLIKLIFFNLIYLYWILYLESSIHNEITHDCNRHRKHGYKDRTYEQRIPNEFIYEFDNRRKNDLNRNQNIVN